MRIVIWCVQLTFGGGEAGAGEGGVIKIWYRESLLGGRFPGGKGEMSKFSAGEG